MDWNAALERVEALSASHRASNDLLRYARAVLRFQKDIYHRAKVENRPDSHKLDTQMLVSFFPAFLQLTEKYGSSELSQKAQKLQERPEWEELLRTCWQQTRESGDLFARSILHPYVQYLAERWRTEVGVFEEGAP